MQRREKVLISACLTGVYCRYDGRHAQCPEIDILAEKYVLIPVCPEQLGGLPTPRPPAEIRGGTGEDVLKGDACVIQVDNGADLTSVFLAGADETLAIAELTNATKAILKTRSPSCGCGTIIINKQKIEGDGVTAAYLKLNGIEVESHE